MASTSVPAKSAASKSTTLVPGARGASGSGISPSGSSAFLRASSASRLTRARVRMQEPTSSNSAVPCRRMCATCTRNGQHVQT
eukprot:5654611-Pleurochrysis_carterae.AAC.3